MDSRLGQAVIDERYHAHRMRLVDRRFAIWSPLAWRSVTTCIRYRQPAAFLIAHSWNNLLAARIAVEMPILGHGAWTCMIETIGV
ncbi:hypothetical protein IG631_23751 [Alternaria alternata]|jgi:hypothetical protein|nr:hypothetical protein IG631_23751 [Alternaria alternata]